MSVLLVEGVLAYTGCKSSSEVPSEHDPRQSGGAFPTGGVTQSGGAVGPDTGGIASSGGRTSGGGDASAGAPACDEPPIDATDCDHPPVKAECAEGWCKIPAGCFVMGAPPCEWGRARDSQNEMLVTLTRPFEIQQHEATVKQWTELGLSSPGGKDEWGADCLDPDCPVGNVSLNEVLTFANLLSEKHEPPLAPCYELTSCTGELGKDFECEEQSQRGDSVYECEGYRLPTKAEWEYAGRAGSRTAYYNGDNMALSTRLECAEETLLDEIAWYCFNSGGTTHPVGKKSPNDWGLYDMLGNASEWSTGREVEPARSKTSVDYEPTLETGSRYAALGGSMLRPNIFLRLANRRGGSANTRAPGFGFRLVRTLPE